MKTNIKTLSTKARLTNSIRSLLYNTSSNNLVSAWKKQKYNIQELSDTQKVLLFNRIWELTQECNTDLTKQRYKRKALTERNRLRLEKGKLPKQKMTLEQYKASLKV